MPSAEGDPTWTPLWTMFARKASRDKIKPPTHLVFETIRQDGLMAVAVPLAGSVGIF